MKSLFIILLIILALIPVLLPCFYIYKKDSEKEPKILLSKLFIAGLIGSIIMVMIDIFVALFNPNLYLFSTSFNAGYLLTFVLVFLQIGLLEEVIKWAFIKVLGYDSKEFDQIYDIIVYCIFVGLGFAFFENLFYVLQGGIKVGILRGLLSVPAHGAYGVFMGYYLGKARVSKDNTSYIKYMILSIFIPTLTHTVYDYILMFDGKIYFYILILYMIFLYVISFIIIDNMSKKKGHLTKN